MSALTVDFAPRPRVVSEPQLAQVIQLPVRRVPDAVTPRRKAASAPHPGVRFLVRAVALLIGLALAVGVGAAVGSAMRPAVAETTQVVVTGGESLWTIAAGIAAPGQDVRDVVAQIVELNSLEGEIVVAGQQLVVPASR